MAPPAAGSSFREEQVDDAYPDGIEENYWNLCRTSLLRRKIDGSPAPILEIGCGRGLVVAGLRRSGLDAWGCDLARVRPICAAVAPFLLLGTDAFDLDAARRATFRTLLLLDVLEHLPEPREFLERCLEELPAVRRVVVTVPARQELWSNYDEYYGHYRRYDAASLEELLDQASLRCHEVGYFFHSLYVPARLLSVLGRGRATKLVAPSGRLARSLHRMVAFGLELESRVLPGSVPGTSLVAVSSAPRG